MQNETLQNDGSKENIETPPDVEWDIPENEGKEYYGVLIDKWGREARCYEPRREDGKNRWLYQRKLDRPVENKSEKIISEINRYFEKVGRKPTINEYTGVVSGITKEDFELWFTNRSVLHPTNGQAVPLILG